MGKLGSTRQEVIQLKSLISLKLGTNVGLVSKSVIMAKNKVKIIYVYLTGCFLFSIFTTRKAM